MSYIKLDFTNTNIPVEDILDYKDEVKKYMVVYMKKQVMKKNF